MDGIEMTARAPIFKVFLGSFFIQSSWSFEKMQSLGFASAISPALNSIYADERSKEEALKRHLAFYNAHPYMASPVLGAAVNLEERASKGEVPYDASATLKKRVMGPYGAIGDAFFWGSIRPLASCIGILASVLWGSWGPVVFLFVYNIFHLWMRWVGLRKGYTLGEGIVGYIKSLDMPEWGKRAKNLAALFLGVLAALTVLEILNISTGGEAGAYLVPGLAIGVPVLAGAVIFLNFFFKKGISVTRLVYLVVLPLILYGVIGY